MEMFRSPDRTKSHADREMLIAKESEAGGSSSLEPNALELELIIELPTLFQPRGWSLTMWPGNSVEHVKRMTRVLIGGKPLDPVTVMAFGDEWYLVDGHHRLAAYQKAKWAEPIPVTTLRSQLSGEARVAFAEDESLSQNSKNRLNLKDNEKADAAWRAIVARSEASKKATAGRYEVSTTTVANMRRVKRELLKHGVSLSDMEHMNWQMAVYQAKRNASPDEDEGDGGFDWEEKRRLMLVKALAPAFKMNVSAELLLDVLDDWRQGFAWEMGEAVDDWRQRTNLDI